MPIDGIDIMKKFQILNGNRGELEFEYIMSLFTPGGEQRSRELKERLARKRGRLSPVSKLPQSANGPGNSDLEDN